MDVTFNSRKLARIFNSENAKLIKRRMAVLVAAFCLDEVSHHPPERRHELIGDKKEKFAVDIKHPYRLVFEPNHSPLPRKADGGLDLSQITAITIIDVEDFH